MPTYEYSCEKCGHQFELFQSISANPIETCPKELCRQKRWGKGPVKKCIGAGAGLLFKGSGFYITDYRSEGYKAAAKKESGAATSSGGSEKSSSSSAGENKPAKAESKPAPAKSSPPSKGRSN
jgi:putative FmdB family regulatory protein